MTDFAPLKEILPQKGTKFEVLGNFRFSIEKEDAIWFLEKGAINLFSIELIEGKPEGPRTLIANFQAPSLIFAIPNGKSFQEEISGITECESTFWKIVIQDCETILSNHFKWIETWIRNISEVLFKNQMVFADYYIKAPDHIDSEKGGVVKLIRALHPHEKERVQWIKIVKGGVQVLGYDSLIVNSESPLFPISYTSWFLASDAFSLQVFEKNENWKESLLFFHQIFRKYLSTRQEIEWQEIEKRNQIRFTEEKKVLQNSLEEMISVLHRIRIKESTAKDPFFSACHIIGKELKIHFEMPLELTSDDPEKKLYAIAEKSGIRCRKVFLENNWWQKDCGPLIALLKEGKKPVVLLPAKLRQYTMIDPETESESKVGEIQAENFEKYAYCFYAPFPREVTSGKHVIAFYLKHNIKGLIHLIAYSVVAAVIALFPPIMMSVLFNRVVPEADISVLWHIFFALLAAAFSSSLFVFFRSLLVIRIEGKASHEIQSAFWDRLLKLPANFFRKYTTGNLILRVMSIDDIRSLLSGNAIRACIAGIFSLAYIFIMWIYAPLLTGIVLGLFVIGGLISLACGIVLIRLQTENFSIRQKINSFLIQIFASIGKLRTTGSENNAFSKWASLFAKNCKLELYSQHFQYFVSVINQILPYLSFACIFTWLIFQKESYSIGSFLAFNAAFISFYIAIIDFNNILIRTTYVVPLWKSTKVIIEEPLEEPVTKVDPQVISGEISLEEIFFRYEPNTPFNLNNITMKINPNEFIGIVGPSGCGKSSIVRLLLGFEKAESGAIYYGGKDISSLDLHALRKQLGVVLQEGGIFSGSLYENLTCGHVQSPEKIEEVLKISEFSEDLKSFPMGLHTYIPMNGETMSGGQKQRLLIARALLADPKVLIFDEATSALDSKSQMKISEKLAKLDLTRIIIAHRLSTIREADRIYVLDKGKIVQVGSFEELSSQQGLFQSMLQRQAL